MRRTLALDVKSEAVFHGENKEYRPLLKRTWSPALPIVAFCMLNPSTADVDFDDPTVAACQVRARQMGFGAVWIVNLFDFRATDPRDMKRAAHPKSLHNDGAILDALHVCEMFVCAWGTHGSHQGRGFAVKDDFLSAKYSHKVYYLRMTKEFHPEHPLYVPLSVMPVRWL